VLVLGIAPEHDSDALRKWGQTRRLEIGHFIGPYFSVDEIRRLAASEVASKITEEQKQLPTDKANLIVITADRSLLFNFHHAAEIILALRDALKPYPHVFAVTVSARCGAGRSERSIKALDDDLLISSVQHGVIDKQQILVFNKHCNVPLSADSVTKIKASFVGEVDKFSG
ncbi:MAG: hypothetical protein ACREDR_18310, partial [Blastocatellia bacterium]